MKKLIFIASVTVGIMIPFALFAQEESGVKIQPSIIEDRVTPGQVIEEVMRVTNLDSETRTFYLVSRDIKGLTDTGVPIFADQGEATPYEVRSWVELSQDPLIIPAGETVETPITIRVPETVGPGGHYGGIFLYLEAQRPETIGAGIGYQVGAILNLRVDGDAIEEAQIRAFKIDKNIYGSLRPEVAFEARVANIGNVLVRPRGPVEILNAFGKQVGLVRVNDSAAAVFPKSERTFQVSWKGESFSFGPHRATMSLVYGEDERKTVSAVATFWVLPLNILLSVVALLLLIVGGIYIFVRAYIRKRLAGMVAADAVDNVQQPAIDPRAHAPNSRLMLVSVILLVFVLILLIALFFLFA